jgi:hypothetical protein
MKNVKYKNVLLKIVLFIAILLFISPQALHAVVVFSDDFNDGVDDGWTHNGETWVVENGEYSGFSAPGARIFSTVDSFVTTTDTVIEVDFFSQSDSSWKNGYITFDYNAPNDFKFVGAGEGNNTWDFIKNS